MQVWIFVLQGIVCSSEGVFIIYNIQYFLLLIVIVIIISSLCGYSWWNFLFLRLPVPHSEVSQCLFVAGLWNPSRGHFPFSGSPLDGAENPKFRLQVLKCSWNIPDVFSSTKARHWWDFPGALPDPGVDLCASVHFGLQLCSAAQGLVSPVEWHFSLLPAGFETHFLGRSRCWFSQLLENAWAWKDQWNDPAEHSVIS